jgi:hypothetical protein
MIPAICLVQQAVCGAPVGLLLWPGPPLIAQKLERFTAAARAHRFASVIMIHHEPALASGVGFEADKYGAPPERETLHCVSLRSE